MSPSQSSEEFNNFSSDLETTITNISLESPFCSFICKMYKVVVLWYR